MSANRPQVCNYKIRNRRERQRWLWSVPGLALLLLAALGCVSAAAQSVAYVPTHKSNSVAAVNTATNSVIDIIPVGIQPLGGAMSPNGQEVYVTNSGWIFGSNSVSVINTYERRHGHDPCWEFPHRRGLHAERRLRLCGE
jgi:YVTN family beta-propeller protein